jgi:hypothetical protein
MTVKERLRELLAALVEEVPDECPTKAAAEAALAAERTSVKRLRALLADLAEEAPDVCPTKQDAEFFAAASAREQAMLAEGIGTVPRFSGQVQAHVSRTPIAGEYVVMLSTPGAGENVYVPASEVAHLGNPAERYDALAAMALARSRDMRAAAAWAGGPSTRTTWTGYVIERKPAPGRRWAVVLRGQRYEVVEHPSFGLRVERENGAAVWTGKLLSTGDFEASSSTLRPSHRAALLKLVRDGDPLHRGQLQTRDEHVRDLARRVDQQETGTTEAVAELMARDFAAQVLFVAHRGPTPVEPRRRGDGYGLYGITSKTWIAIRPDGWPVLAPGPEGSVETWPTKTAVQEAIDAATRAERTRR